MEVTVIIPAYNEAEGIKKTLVELVEYISDDWEVLVVDDGSKDATFDIVSNIGYKNVRCIRHRKNRGYGSAIKTGCKNAKGDIVAWYDADGQHRPEDLVAVVQTMETKELDYCIGVRKKDSHFDRNRKMGKYFLAKIVNVLAKEPVKDFNSGMRAFSKGVLMKYLSLLPNRFGASTVTTFIMQEVECVGDEIDILVRKRIGKSTVRPIKDGIRTLSLIMNIILLFRPKEVFGTLGILTIAWGGGIWINLCGY